MQNATAPKASNKRHRRDEIILKLNCATASGHEADSHRTYHINETEAYTQE